ncbi:MAG TPA: hypothetical protein PLB90_15505 [Opitutaceae bacterium]|nr:hypothetical protein [Opitutaceae bacterium]
MTTLCARLAAPPRRRRAWQKWCVAGLTATLAAAAPAGVMRYVHNAPESANDRRYVYHWKILETALERTRAEYGDYVLTAAEPMSESRQTYELRQATGLLTVMYRGTTPEMERDLLPVRIPVDKDLGGYSVFLLRRAQLGRYAGSRTAADLRGVRFGLGLGWIDVGILRAAGLTVVTGSTYEGLFEMLNNDRFDIFLRAAVEVLDELETRRGRFPDLVIEPEVALYYPMPMYFWFPRTDEGRSLAARAEAGMRAMIADGTYDRIFAEYQDWKIRRLDLRHRRIIRLPNPNLGPETPFADRRLWFDPETYSPSGR